MSLGLTRELPVKASASYERARAAAEWRRAQDRLTASCLCQENRL